MNAQILGTDVNSELVQMMYDVDSVNSKLYIGKFVNVPEEYKTECYENIEIYNAYPAYWPILSYIENGAFFVTEIGFEISEVDIY